MAERTRPPAELEFGDARPGEGEARRCLGGEPGREQRVFKPQRGLFGVGLGEEFRCKLGRRLNGGGRSRSFGRAARDRINDETEGVGETMLDGIGGGSLVE